MLGDTEVSFVGRLGSDPELRFTPTGDAVASLSVAVQSRRKNETGTYEDGATTWHRVAVWRDLAENVAASLRKGDLVVVHGSLVQSDYVGKEGEKRSSYQVTAREVAPSLRFVGCQLRRPARASDVASDPTSKVSPVGDAGWSAAVSGASLATAAAPF